MKKICSLMFFLLVMASVSQGAGFLQGPGPGEDDSAERPRAHSWGHFGDTPPPGDTTPSPEGDFSSLSDLGAAGDRDSPVPVALVPGTTAGSPGDGVGGGLPAPGEGAWSIGDFLNSISTAAGVLFGSRDDNPAVAPVSSPEPTTEAASPAAADAPAGVAVPAPVLEPPPVILDHLDEYFNGVPVGPACGGPLNAGDVCAAEGLRLLTLWANSERDGVSLWPGYRPGIHKDLELTWPLLQTIGLSRMLVGWQVSDLKMTFIRDNISLTDPSTVVSVGIAWWHKYVPEQIFSLTLRAPNGFELAFISGHQPRNIRELMLDMMTLKNPREILGEGRKRVAEVYGVHGAENPILKAAGLLGEEVLTDHQIRVEKRIDWIRRFLDDRKPHAVVGGLGVGSLLVAICRQREGTDQQQVSRVYGFDVWSELDMSSVIDTEQDVPHDVPLLGHRVGAYRLFKTPGNLLSEPQSQVFGTQILVQPQAFPEPVPAQKDFWNWNWNLSELFSRTWESCFCWPDISFLWNWTYVAKPETPESLTRKILDGVDIMTMSRKMLWWFRNQMTEAEAEAAANAAAEAAPTPQQNQWLEEKSIEDHDQWT